MKKAEKQNSSIEKPQQDEEKPKVSLEPYIGVWIKGKGGNLPVICFHPDLAEEVEEFVKTKFNGKYLTAAIKIEKRPLVNRLNIRAIKRLAASLLQKITQTNTKTN